MISPLADEAIVRISQTGAPFSYAVVATFSIFPAILFFSLLQSRTPSWIYGQQKRPTTSSSLSHDPPNDIDIETQTRSCKRIKSKRWHNDSDSFVWERSKTDAMRESPSSIPSTKQVLILVHAYAPPLVKHSFARRVRSRLLPVAFIQGEPCDSIVPILRGVRVNW